MGMHINGVVSYPEKILKHVIDLIPEASNIAYYFYRINKPKRSSAMAYVNRLSRTSVPTVFLGISLTDFWENGILNLLHEIGECTTDSHECANDYCAQKIQELTKTKIVPNDWAEVNNKYTASIFSKIENQSLGYYSIDYKKCGKKIQTIIGGDYSTVVPLYDTVQKGILTIKRKNQKRGVHWVEPSAYDLSQNGYEAAPTRLLIEGEIVFP